MYSIVTGPSRAIPHALVGGPGLAPSPSCALAHLGSAGVIEAVLAPERDEVLALGGLHIIGTNLHCAEETVEARLLRLWKRFIKLIGVCHSGVILTKAAVRNTSRS